MILAANTPVDTGFTGSTQPIIQNLGPGNIYIGPYGIDLPTKGLYLPAGAVYEFPANLVDGTGTVWVVADTADTDVRIINVG